MAVAIPVWLENAYMSGCVQDSNTIVRAAFALLRSSNTVETVRRLRQ